jgi:hypothetical protein
MCIYLAAEWKEKEGILSSRQSIDGSKISSISIN